jgi:hypothetical protein
MLEPGGSRLISSAAGWALSLVLFTMIIGKSDAVWGLSSVSRFFYDVVHIPVVFPSVVSKQALPYLEMR